MMFPVKRVKDELVKEVEAERCPPVRISPDMTKCFPSFSIFLVPELLEKLQAEKIKSEDKTNAKIFIFLFIFYHLIHD